jgi:hypothetical protein
MAPAPTAGAIQVSRTSFLLSRATKRPPQSTTTMIVRPSGDTPTPEKSTPCWGVSI